MGISFQDFEKVDMRVGTVIKAEVNSKAKKPAYKMEIDFGELGIKRSSAQITKFYKPKDLVGKQVIAVVNFPPKIIADFSSEVLVLGVIQGKDEEDIILLEPERKAINGKRIS
ncbi:MAG: tRNA-binding protein [Candidatus Nanoarchaeia archaeon]|nr:tRNA-binding protein [Candidatus Nanoarchaeia archaeon]MDD5741770.1 tRNA-binding protein [Candidatus Nanoarchaeia archaeon]